MSHADATPASTPRPLAPCDREWFEGVLQAMEDRVGARIDAARATSARGDAELWEAVAKLGREAGGAAGAEAGGAAGKRWSAITAAIALLSLVVNSLLSQPAPPATAERVRAIPGALRAPILPTPPE